MCLVCGEYAWSVLLVDVGFDCNGGIFLRVCDVGPFGVPVESVVVFRGENYLLHSYATLPTSLSVVMAAFFLACKEYWGRFDESFPSHAFSFFFDGN